MVARAAKRKSGGRGGGARGKPGKRSAEDEFLDDHVGSLIFADDEEEAKEKGEDEEDEEGVSEDEEEQETAEERRLRIAKVYVEQIRRGQQEDRDDEFVGVTGGEDDEAGGDVDERVAAQLREDALEADGRLRRRISHLVDLPDLLPESSSPLFPAGGRLLHQRRPGSGPGHRLSATCAAVTPDGRSAFSVGKDGTVASWDVETGKGTQVDAPGGLGGPGALGSKSPKPAADWVKRQAPGLTRGALLACAVSPDGRYLAVGGADCKVHVYDARANRHVQSYPGHQGPVTCLAFRQAAGAAGLQLVSGSYDRTVKVWSLQDGMYIDTLFGHQSEVLCCDMGRTEVAVSGGYDKTCRVWKIADSKQAVFRSPSMATESVAYVSRDEWVAGGNDGTLCLYQAQRKKPVRVVHRPHAPLYQQQQQQQEQQQEDGKAGGGEGGGSCGEVLGAGSVGGDVCSWVLGVGSARGTDLAASGAGDGVIRLWGVRSCSEQGGPALRQVGALPARGFANSVSLADGGRLLVAAMGQEPRLGRWARDSRAANGVLIARIPLRDDGGGSSSSDGSVSEDGDEEGGSSGDE